MWSMEGTEDSEGKKIFMKKVSKKKPARELRQRRGGYRCCIPALAGLTDLQSIVPDGTGI